MEADNLEKILKGTPPYYEDQQLFPIESERMKNGELMLLFDMLNSGCQYNCLKCFSDVSKVYLNQLPNKVIVKELSWEIREKLYREARDLGARSVFIPGSGEPLLSRHIDNIVNLTYRIGLNLVLFTNGLLFTEEKAKEYFSKGVSTVFSLDSADEKTYNILTSTEGNFKKVMANLEAALHISEGYITKTDKFNIVQLSVHTNPNLLTYNTKKGIDEIGKIHDVIGGRALHFVSFLSPKGKCLESWDILVGESNNPRNEMFVEAVNKYSSRQDKCSARGDKRCGFINNAVVQFAGYWMACASYGLATDFGKYPEICIESHFKAKKEFLKLLGNPQCITRMENK